MRSLRQQITVAAALLLLSPVVAHAQTLTVAWDPNPPADQVTSYEVCIGTASLSCNFRQASVPATETTYTVTPNAGVLYYVAVRAISAAGAGNYSSEVSFSTPLLSQPANQSSPLNVAITPLSLSATDPDGDSLQFSHSGLPLGLVLNQATGVITGTPIGLGTFTVTIFVADNLVTTSRTFVWTIGSGGSSDTTQPSLSITSHTSGQTVSTSSITLAGTATDNSAGNSGITGVTVNGAAATGGTATGSGTASWSRSVALATGANTLTVVATDGAGNSRSSQITITRAAAPDTTQPALNITSHTSGQTVATSTIALSGTATDSSRGGSGIASVTVNGAAATGGTATGSGTANWSRSVSLSTGANTLTVVATDGAGNQRTSTVSVTYAPSIAPMTGASLSQNLASPQTTGTTITFTASGSGGVGPYEYQWYLQQNGGVWTMLRSWNTTTTYAWTPTQPGTYVMAIWARSAGSTANAWQAYAERTLVIDAPATAPATPPPASPGPSVPMSAAWLTTTTNSPQVTGATVTFTANGSGGTAPYEYQWYLQQNGGVWTMLRSWSATTTYAWTPTQPGNYVMALWARSAGSTANAWQAYAERAFVISTSATAPAPTTPTPTSPTPSVPMTAAWLTSTSPQVTGTTVTFTANGSGGTAPYEYQWYLQQNGVWTMLRSWSTTTTYAWTPSQAGTYVMAIWARSAGSTANAWQAYAERTLVIAASGTAPPPPPPTSPGPSVPMSAAWLTTTASSPQVTGTTVTFTANGSGGTAPYEYQWYLQQNGGVWTMLRSWSATTTYAWTPTQPGNYVMALWARSSGSTANAWQAYAERPFVINAPTSPATPPAPIVTTPMTAAWVSATLSSPQREGTTVTFVAGGSGGIAPHEYQWYVQRNGGAWQLVRAWSTATSYVLSNPQPGTYIVAVWARSAGTTVNVWQAYGERPFVIEP